MKNLISPNSNASTEVQTSALANLLTAARSCAHSAADLAASLKSSTSQAAQDKFESAKSAIESATSKTEAALTARPFIAVGSAFFVGMLLTKICSTRRVKA